MMIQYNYMELLNKPYWIVDILPARVPKDSEGQYFAVERFMRQPDRIVSIHRKQAQILLLLNCYYDMAVSLDGGDNWIKNPDSEEFCDQLISLPLDTFLRVLFISQDTMIDINPDDTYMTAYNPSTELLEKLQQLAGAEGLFVWPGVQD
ncbi:MAG: hypothetical protein IKH67_05375 [Lachnospiraceae bacterium]|nr:hypothetical protein [Lachnospiraceae bacterium]